MEPSQIVKKLHKSLRVKVKQGDTPENVWTELLKDKEQLSMYSKSMNELATNEWDKNCKENRILWCKQVCLDYFNDGGLQKLAVKLHKRKLFQALRTCGIQENDEERKKINDSIAQLIVTYNTVLKDKYLLLDVGSCFNPFKRFEEFFPVAIDISPANDEVLYCDFLNIQFEHTNSSENTEKTIKCALNENIHSGKLFSNFFDCVIFSLLLSYFPSPSQRLRCCINAHRSLKLHGLLVIITPDSSHQNRHQKMMKSWKEALEGIGFTRYRYEKLEHLHCMAYQKSSESVPDSDVDFSEHLYIPQDSQSLDELLKTEDSEA